MVQQGQIFELTRRGRDGERLWAFRFRTGGRGSRRVQRGGFACEQDARAALEHELDRVRRECRICRSLTLAELVETYLAQHDVQPVTIEKLRYLLSKATAVFGDRRVGELTSQEIAEWRMTLSPGYRFEATQALRQVLHRAVAWGMIDVNPAKVGVDNPTRRDWERVAGECVAILRWAAGRDPDDRDLSDLVGELATQSEAFRSRWAAHDVRFHNTGVKHLHHPEVGELSLSYNRLDLAADHGLTIFTYAAEPGSRSEEALKLLGSWAATVDNAEPARATDQS